MIYRLSCEVIIDAPDAAQAADKLRDALCEVDGEVDCVNWCEVSEPPRDERGGYAGGVQGKVSPYLDKNILTAADVLFGGFREAM